MTNNSIFPGSCCNTQTCTLYPTSHICRPVSSIECDLPEHCDGLSEWCPADSFKADGTGCNNRDPGYCYNGLCRTHSSQCFKIWGVQSAKNAKDACYTLNSYREFQQFARVNREFYSTMIVVLKHLCQLSTSFYRHYKRQECKTRKYKSNFFWIK